MIRLWCIALFVCMAAFGQTAVVQGTVSDETGAVIPGANVTLSGPGGPKTTSANEVGAYRFAGVSPGTYSLRVETTGFAPLERSGIAVGAGRTITIDAPLKLQVTKQEVKVEGENLNQVSTDPTANAGAIILRGDDLQALSDDPDDLAQDLQALAGPAAGPNGGQIFVDGFSGGRLPPKASIREIRINSNPFAAEYDRLGFGRIEIFTKPGADKFRGQAFFNFSDGAFNSRNPYASNKPDFQSRFFGFDLSGPINRRSSFSFNAERRDIDDNAIVNATILDPSFNFATLSQGIQTPLKRTSISPRIDVQLNEKNTLVGRYHWTRTGNQLAGIGDLTTLSRAYDSERTEHTLQLTETAILSPTLINELRFQFQRQRNSQIASVNEPALNVLGNFNAGGNPLGNSSVRENHWELNNVTSLTRGTHSIKFGGRLRRVDLLDESPQNFLGTFTFGGGVAPALDSSFNPVVNPEGQVVQLPISSLERYRRTLQLIALGYSPVQIRTLGGGATQFSIAAGNPLANVDQYDAAAFLQDDWRARPNLTLSLGLRAEGQTNIPNKFNFAPRVGFAWAPGQKGTRAGRTVIRGGVGLFYDRFSENFYLSTQRFNGINQLQYIVQNPDFYPLAPPVSTFTNSNTLQTIRNIDPGLHAPYLIQTAIGVERQLPKNTTAAVTYTFTRGLHMLRSSSTIDANRVFEYKSDGILNQQQVITNLNTRFNSRVTLFSFYVLNFAKTNADGVGSFPAVPDRLDLDYGRAGNDIRHRFFIGGSLTAPWGLRLNPFITANSGAPFNVTSGRDFNGDLVFTDRPSFATDLTRASVVVTRFGAFDTSPLPGSTIIPRNYGQGPAFFSVNLRLSKTFGFGETTTAAAPERRGGPGGGMREGGGGGGPRGGGMRMSGGAGRRGGGGGGGMFGETSNRHYSLTFSIQARNLFNTTNPGLPIGELSSSRFGQSNQLAGGFGPDRGVANNRRLELQVRFTF